MQIFCYFMQFNLHFFICCVRISWSFERGRDKMDDITVMQLADKYNDSLKKMIDPNKIEKNQNEDPVSVAKKIYNNKFTIFSFICYNFFFFHYKFHSFLASFQCTHSDRAFIFFIFSFQNIKN